jgi:hypothetical protein
MSAQKLKGKELRDLLARLREERGATVDAAVARNKARQAARKKVRAAMASGAATVPAIAAASALPSGEVLWHVAAMRKYGALVETGQEGDYPTYALKADEKPEAKEAAPTAPDVEAGAQADAAAAGGDSAGSGANDDPKGGE